MLQWVPAWREEEEEAEATAMLHFAPSGCCCLAEGGLGANSGIRCSRGWALALPGQSREKAPFRGGF